MVTLGGGTGSPALLRGLRRYVDQIDITAIVTTFDDGGSSGMLRREFGIPALGDVRRCIAALTPKSQASSVLEYLMEHRFSSSGALENHALGNLMLLAEMERCGSLESAIDSISQALESVGRVLPISEEPSELCAEMADGTVIRGESSIGDRPISAVPISRIYLDPPVNANFRALDALHQADLVVLGPGDLFTSVIPNLLADGVTDALTASDARVLQICNISTKPGETHGFCASDFVLSANRYLASEVDAIIVNEFEPGTIPPDGAVRIDPLLQDVVDTVMIRRVADAAHPIMHDSEKLARAVMQYLTDTDR